MDHPAAEFLLLQMAGCLVAAGKDRGREVEFETEVAVEFICELLGKAAVGIEPRDLVFVLVGHQLEQIARDRLREPLLAAAARRFRGFRFFDQHPVARGVSPVLVIG